MSTPGTKTDHRRTNLLRTNPLLLSAIAGGTHTWRHKATSAVEGQRVESSLVSAVPRNRPEPRTAASLASTQDPADKRPEQSRLPPCHERLHQPGRNSWITSPCSGIGYGQRHCQLDGTGQQPKTHLTARQSRVQQPSEHTGTTAQPAIAAKPKHRLNPQQVPQDPHLRPPHARTARKQIPHKAKETENENPEGNVANLRSARKRRWGF